MSTNNPTPPVEGAVLVNYSFNTVDIPPSFLTTTPPSKPTSRPVDFADNDLPEFEDCIALVVDGVLSPAECTDLIRLAESSVPLKDESSSAWRPAMIAIGDGWEIPAPGYRVSDRIIWDQQQVADRILDRCLLADGARETLEKKLPGRNGGWWKLHSLNERMRFLKYTKGQFFKPHTDSRTFVEKDGKELRTHYTLHLYLNDSEDESSTGEGIVGGATAFVSRDGNRRLEVNPKAGSALIFQHESLRHEGAMVKEGVKYTVRSEVFYELVPSAAPRRERDE